VTEVTQQTHRLKTWPEYFNAVVDGTKTFEVRKNDRNYQIGDMLVLKEFDPQKQTFTLRITYRVICYVLPGGQFGIETGYCVLGLREPELRSLRMVDEFNQLRESELEKTKLENWNASWSQGVRA